MSRTSRATKMVLLTAVVLADLQPAPYAEFLRSDVAQEGAVPPETEENPELKREMDELVREDMKIEALTRTNEISTRLKITPEAFLDFFKDEQLAGRRTDRIDRAWSKLLNGIHVPMRSDVTEADFESARITGDTVGAFIKMKLSLAVDDLRLSPEELATVQTHWTLQDRRNFARVLQRAWEIVDRREAATLQQAYEQALRESAEKAIDCRQ